MTGASGAAGAAVSTIRTPPLERMTAARRSTGEAITRVFEEIPFDLAGDTRIRDIAGVGTSGFNVIDRGTYETQPATCGAADINGDGLLDLSDISLFVQSFLNRQAPADLAPPTGVYDLADINAFISAFQQGCP